MRSSFMRRTGWIVVGLWLTLFTPSVRAEAPDPSAAQSAPEAVQEAAVDLAPVVVDGRALFSVRGVTASPSKQRAARIATRIEQIARDPGFDPRQLKLVHEDLFSSIYAGDLLVMVVVDADARAESVAREVLARAIQDRIATAVQDYRKERSRDYLLNSGLQVLLASGVFVLFLWVLRRLSRRVHASLGRVAKKRMEALEAKTFSLVRAQQIWKLIASASVLAKWVLILFAADAYLGYSLGLFPWTRPFAEILLNTLSVPLKHMLDGLAQALPGLAFIVVLVVVIRYLLGLVRLFFAGIADRSIAWQGIEPDWAFPTYRLVRLLIIVFGLVVAYPYIPGSSSEAFKGLSLMFGLLLSLGASSIIGNILAGYSLIYRRAFKVGDRIKVGEHVGEVTLMGALVTHLRTPKNEVVVVPNSEILSSSIVNYSTLKQEQGLILHTTVGIGYETPWRQVEAMLLLAADRTAGLLKQPEPFVLKKSLGDFCVVYEINAYVDAPESMPRLYSLIHQNILDVFNEYGVQIMTPAYEGDPAEPKLVPKEAWYADPAKPPAAEPGKS